MPFLLCKRTGGAESGFVINEFNPINDGKIEGVGDETGTDALNHVRSGHGIFTAQGLCNDGAIGRFHGHRGNGLVFDLFDVSTDAADGAAGTHRTYENINFAIGIFPDFRAGGFDMDFGIGRILELLGHEVFFRIRGDHFLRFGNGAKHAAGTVGQDQISSERFEYFPALETHRFGHSQNNIIPACSAHIGECDTGVATGGLDDRHAGLQQALFLGVPDHGSPDPALDRVAGVAPLYFGQNQSAVVRNNVRELYERRTPDR